MLSRFNRIYTLVLGNLFFIKSITNLDYYSIDEDYDLNDYDDYRKAVDAIRNASRTEISRNGFDHLLWYYHGRL